jgi:hypothetical protein
MTRWRFVHCLALVFVTFAATAFAEVSVPWFFSDHKKLRVFVRAKK